MSRHRAPARPRYGRIAAAGMSVLVMVVALLGGVGLLPTGSSGTPAGATPAAPGARAELTSGEGTETSEEAAPSRIATVPVLRPRAATLPAGSGTGKRVVFSEGRQRVWLVTADDEVLRTYPVSGSLHDNLDPGTYAVFSRSEQAWGIDDSGTMRWFVRFAHGPNAAIGFHDIPVDDGERVQTAAQLGTPQSHGCIRQRTRDAIALWEFAPIGTTVVVTA